MTPILERIPLAGGSRVQLFNSDSVVVWKAECPVSGAHFFLTVNLLLWALCCLVSGGGDVGDGRLYRSFTASLEGVDA